MGSNMAVRFKSGYNFWGRKYFLRKHGSHRSFESLKTDQEYHSFIKTQQNLHQILYSTTFTKTLRNRIRVLWFGIWKSKLKRLEKWKRIGSILKQKWPEMILEILGDYHRTLGAFALTNWTESEVESNWNKEILYADKWKSQLEILRPINSPNSMSAILAYPNNRLRFSAGKSTNYDEHNWNLWMAESIWIRFRIPKSSGLSAKILRTRLSFRDKPASSGFDHLLCETFIFLYQAIFDVEERVRWRT